MDVNFYSPLSATGYLTPLQRKKLREKRCLSPSVSLESEEMKKCVKPRLMKRKKETANPFVSSKRQKRTKSKEQVSQIQCSAAQVICKTNDYLKEKKFFKSSSSGRLEKANFSMPFVYKKNTFLKINKNIRKFSLHPKKCTTLKEHSFNIQSCQDDVSSNVDEDRINITPPYIVKITCDFSEKTEASLQKELTDNMTESLQTFFDFEWPSDEMLLKRQVEARASLKQKLTNKHPEDSNILEKHDIDKPVQKLYPIFYKGSREQQKSQVDIKRKQKNGIKKLKDSSTGGEQMLIDAGQKKFGAKVCSTCNMIYSMGVEEDERLHFNYHNTYLINLKFIGWKEENVIGEYPDGRIIIVLRKDQNFKIKKIEDILEIVNRDLGFPNALLPLKQDLTFVLFISSSKQVVGCVVAEPITCASRVLLSEDNESVQKETTWRIGNWYSSSDTEPAVCGVNRIWVAHNYRRCKVASRMIDSLRCHFVHGHVIGIRELAFTDPTPDGREFAASYTGTDNFLVYR